MTFASELGGDFNQVLNYGQQVRFRYFTISGGSATYDDDVTLSKSGNDLWISGVVCNIGGKKGSYDAVLVQQGKLVSNDLKLYVAGSISTSGTWRVGLGSPTSREYMPVEDGITAWTINDVPIYKKIYLRVLTNGSIIGE